MRLRFALALAARTSMIGSGEGYSISSKAGLPKIDVTTIHLSCGSSIYQGPNYKYAGCILYAHNGKTEWTLNDWRCKAGYLVVRDTSFSSVKQHIGKAEGKVHGAVYKSMFGEDVGDTVGEGFAVIDGELRLKSLTFNVRTTYHDCDENISSLTKKCLEKVIKAWMEEGERYQRLCSQNFSVKDLLKD